MAYPDSLKQNLEQVFMLPAPAIQWLLMLWEATQLFDDVADKDEINRESLNSVIWNVLVAMPQNQFWRENSLVLAPIVGAAILKWQASDRAERDGNADAKSFIWRAGYYDVVLMAVQLCHGADAAVKVAHHVMALYGENFEDYMREFGNA